MKQNKKGNLFFKILFIFFIIYLALFIANETGYYEKRVRDRTIMTQNQLDKFEEDLANNKELDLIDYFPQEEDYSNVFTKTANQIANKLSVIVNNNADSVWDFIKTLFIS